MQRLSGEERDGLETERVLWAGTAAGPRTPAPGLTCTLLPFRCILRIMLPWVVTSVQ